MRQPLAVVASVAAAVALGLGSALGIVLDRRDRPPSPLVVVSQWQSRAGQTTTKVVAGSLASAPARGFVIFHETGAPPAFFTTPGQLRLVAASDWGWVLETPTGVRAVLEAGSPDSASFEVLGRQLDPAALPRIAAAGVAVPLVYGRLSKAVVLVGYDARTDSFVQYGFLRGFSLPPATDRLGALHRLLLGPDGGLYRVDPARRRLVLAGESAKQSQPAFALPPRCSDWGRYRACADSISTGGRTLLRQAPLKYIDRRWVFVAPSPDGRTLLLEQDIFSCGNDPQAYLLSTSGGDLRPAVPALDAQSEPIGWLRSGTALVALQSGGGCDGSPVSGIYRVDPLTGDDRLVLSAAAYDATVWGRLAAPQG